MNLQDFASNYKCDTATNNYIHKVFTEKTASIDFLKKHRDFIEENKLGFGDRAFHYMWYLVLQSLFENNERPHLLEIGVYKGQVISLWSLISRQLQRTCNITCISPLQGNTAPKNRFLFYWRYIASRKFRDDTRAG